MSTPKINQAALNPLIAHRRYSHLAQGARLFTAHFDSMFKELCHNPSRMQVSEGYTYPLQKFATSNTWNTLQAQTATGELARQPSLKRASPFNLPIPTRMPWDV